MATGAAMRWSMDVPDTSITLEDRASAAYLGMAIGDALGATVEFMTPREIAAEHGVHARIRGGGWLRLKAGQVTDDTTMALALGEAILRLGRVDARAVAEAFDAWMRAKPVDIGNTVRRGIIAFRKSGVPVMQENAYDAGNGAAMRVLPVALASLGATEDVVCQLCRVQAHVTHNNALSDAATECIALMLQDALAGLDKWAIMRRRADPLIALHPEFEYRKQRRENPGGYVVETLQAVFQALADSHNYRDCLVDVVNRGGDADTTGAIAGMLAGALYGRGDLPDEWLAALDRDVRTSCSRQAAALLLLGFRQAPRPAAENPAPDRR